MDRFRYVFFAFALLVGSLMLGPSANAQDQMKVGDTIEFDFLGEKKQAQIIKFTGTGWPVVKFQHRDREMERFFPKNRVKVVAGNQPAAPAPQVPSNATSNATSITTANTTSSPMRQWADSTGKFKIQAKILSQTDDTVELEKSDGLVIKLPVNKLSKGDQAYLKELIGESNTDNPFAGGVMKADDSQPRKNSPTTKPAVAIAHVAATKPAATQNRRTLTDNGWRYQSTSPRENADALSPDTINLPASDSKHAFHNRVSVAISIDKAKMAVGRTNPFDDDTELFVVDLQARNAGAVAKVAIKDSGVFAVSPDGNVVVTHRKSRGSKTGAVDFWKVSGHVASHAASWQTAGFSDRNGFDPSQAMFVGSTRLLTIGRNIVLWNLAGPKAEYSIPINGRSATTISNSGRELAIVDGSDIVLIGVAQGDALGRFTPPTTGTSSLAFSPGGQFLAGLNSSDSSIWVWDLEANELAQQLGAPSRATSLRWVRDRYLLISNQLVDVELRVPVWQYTVSGGELVSGLGDAFWLVGKTNATPIRLPHQELDAQTASLDPEQLLVLKPGAEVALDFQLPFPPAELKTIRDKIASSLQSNQITINQSAALRLVAKVTKGKSDTTTVSRFGMFGGGDKVSYTPHTGSVALVSGGNTLWSQSRFFGPAGVISIKQGETAQQAVTKVSQPNSSFFSSIRLPKYLAAMPDGKPLGTSAISQAGVK